VPIEGLDRKQLEKLADAGASVTVAASLLLALVVKLEQLEEEIARLKRDSRTSSKPPSTDRANPGKPEWKKKRRGDGKRKPGAQNGHQGKTLKQVADPDTVLTHRLGGRCAHCDTDLHGVGADGYERRQVFDLPEKITMEVTEHRAERGTCPCCARPVRATFPEGVNAPVQYGERTLAVVLYLQTYQLLPCERLGEQGLRI